MKQTSNDQKTLEWFSDRGFLATKCTWFAHGRHHDLFGIFDVVVIGAGYPTLYVQATSNNGGNHAARRRKIMEENRQAFNEIVAEGNGVAIMSWKKGKDTPRLEVLSGESRFLENLVKNDAYREGRKRKVD